MYTATDEELTYLLDFAARYADKTQDKLTPKPPLDDLISAGNLGIVKALRAFDPSKGVPFEALGVMKIKWSVASYLDYMFYGHKRPAGNDAQKLPLRCLQQMSPMMESRFYRYSMKLDKQMELEMRIRKLSPEDQELVEEVLAGHTVEEIAKKRGWGGRKMLRTSRILAKVTGVEKFNICLQR